MKILYIGNETSDTDLQVESLAASANTFNHRLISDPTLIITQPGFYHSTVTDLMAAEIVKLAYQFDKVVMLDQPKETYPHYKSLMNTILTMETIEANGIAVDFRNNNNTKNFLNWQELLKKNKSFCHHAFTSIISDTDKISLCPKNTHNPIKKLEDIINWETDSDYLQIRNKMSAGELIMDRCSDCYAREKEGQESTRQYETLEWAEKLKCETIDDFFKIKNPVFYEIRPSNKCNIMCRTCDDARSHLIEREWKQHGTIPLIDWRFINTPVDKINFSSAKRIYYGGGEPTIMPEFYEFLRRARDLGHTEFELTIGTNGMKFSNTLLDLLDNFSDVVFSISFDGYKKVNDYIRWGSDWNTIIANSRVARERGHKVSLQTIFSMWSISRMHEIFEFYDQEFPGHGLLVQVGAGQNDAFMPYNHPNPKMVAESMRRCQETNVYHMIGRSVKSMVDLMFDYYSNPSYNCNIEQLKKFYEFNDKLDSFRNTKLGDYIPELEEGRKLCQ